MLLYNILAYILLCKCICGAIVGIFASSAVDCYIDPRLGQSKNYEIGISWFCAKYAA